MAADFNLNAYFERIGFAGSIAPNLQTLQALVLAHVTAIPFENLNPLLRLPVPLDLPSLEQKLIRERRGGWCFEHNTLMMHALRALEFEVKPLAARVLWGVPPETITRRSHIILHVDIGGSVYLVDAGFADVTPTAPLRLRPDIEQETPNGIYRITGADPEIGIEIKNGDDWRRFCRFDLSEQFEIDFEAMNWYLATNPASAFFRENLIVTMPRGDGRLSLFNTELKTSGGGGDTLETLSSVAEIKEALTQRFGIALSPADLLDPALEKIVAGGQPA